MGRASSPSSRSERITNLWCPSAIPAWGCPRSRRTRSSMRSLPRSLMGPVWDCPSAAPSLNRIAADYGLSTTLRAAQVFTSFYPTKLSHMNDAVTGNPTMFVIDDDAMPTELYVCNDAGVYVTKDAGLTWLNATANLPNVMVVDLVY